MSDALRERLKDADIHASQGIGDDPLGAIGALLSRETDQTTS